jgi:hypothetical protein
LYTAPLDPSIWGFVARSVIAAPRETHSTPGRDVLLALARLDRVKRHPDRLQRLRAETTERWARLS